ncbi:hypothetical protein KM043_004177 [Ampulex compressa]|nr:hypothetical protein KM043_004177 [Ampulex compressa]
MAGKTGSSSPPNEDAYRKRRDSYSAAITNENSLDDEKTETCRHPESLAQPCRGIGRRGPKLLDNSSLESEPWSVESSASKRELAGTPSADTARSWSELEIPEMFPSHPETLSRIIKCHCFLATKLSLSSDCSCQYHCQCQCRSQCRCSQCQYRRRKISSSSSRDQPFLSGSRRKDSGFSVSTCQSILPPSSGRNSAVSLCHDIREDRQDVGEVIQRRHSDQTHSLHGYKIGRADNRRFSEQAFAADAVECSARSGTMRPIIPRGCPRVFPEATAPRPKQSWSLTRKESYEVKPRCKDGASDLDSEGELRHSEVDRGRKDSGVEITPKMMRRRFSEQLILEGGLSTHQEFEDLLRERGGVEEEESLSAINARKKITLKRHYYPDGGWGHVIILVAFLVQLISHGLQLGYGVLVPSVAGRFDKAVGHTGTVDS